MTKTHKTYEDGLQAGRIEAMKSSIDQHDIRLTDHARRLQILERLFWGGAGVLIFLQTWPLVKPWLAL
ncbi:MAG: hypothetical protein AAF442_09685 [Pseudomonadota bacterium]